MIAIVPPKPEYLNESKTQETRTRWGNRREVHIKGIVLEVFGASDEEIRRITHTLSQVPALHIRQIPRIVVGRRVGPIGTGRITRGGNSARLGPRENWRLELTRYALANKIRTIEGYPVCYTLLHELGHWIDWQLGLYPHNAGHRQVLASWFRTLNYPGVTQGRGEQVAEAYWRYFLGGLPPAIVRILEASPAFTRLPTGGGGSLTSELITDHTFAVRIFSAAQRSRIVTPLLSPARNASAITWNSGKHPSDSGINATTLRSEIARYIDLAAVQRAITNYNATHASNTIAPGSPPFDAVFAEAVHQFQKKVFIDSGQKDGKAGAFTLDSLGLIDRSGMKTNNQVNNTSKRRLRTVGTRITVSGTRVDHTNWFDFITNPSLFGWQSSNGLHYSLALRLRQAENHLLNQAAYRNMTPADLGRALGLRARHGGYRPTKTNGSMHNYGLAVDIDYIGNPWVSSRSFWNVLKRSAQLISGNRFWVAGSRTIASATAYYDHLARQGGTTTQIYDQLRRLHDDFKRYLRFRNNLSGLQSFIGSSSAPAGVKRSGESDAQAASRWQQTIQDDYNDLNRQGDFINRNASNGFLNLHRDLVVALRDHACLAWGGIDFGDRASGDMMHFDVRSISPFDAVCRAGGGFVPGNYHPCRQAGNRSASEKTPTVERSFLEDILERNYVKELYTGPPSPTGGGSAFDQYILQLGGLENEAITLGQTINQRITSFRKIYYNSASAARTYAGAVIGGGVWNILIPGASGTVPPRRWQSDPVARSAAAYLKQNKVIPVNGVTSDLGHLFAGLDAANHHTSLRLAGGIVRMRSNQEAVTFIGDLGSVVVEYLYGYQSSFYNVAKRLNRGTLVRIYRQFASEPDMNGNVDAYSLRVSPSKTLTKNLIDYYGARTGGVKKRYTQFARRIGWGTLTSAGFTRLTSRRKTTFREEIFNSALAYAAGTGRRADVINVLNNPGPGIITPTFWDAYWNISGWVLDQFIQQVKMKIRSE